MSWLTAARSTSAVRDPSISQQLSQARCALDNAAATATAWLCSWLCSLCDFCAGRPFSGKEAGDIFLALLHELPWTQREVVVMGQRIPEPRLRKCPPALRACSLLTSTTHNAEAYLGDDESLYYRYSGLTVVPSPWTPTVLRVRNKLKEVRSTLQRPHFVDAWPSPARLIQSMCSCSFSSFRNANSILRCVTSTATATTTW